MEVGLVQKRSDLSSSQEVPPDVLVEVLVEIRVVLVENLCVGGILGCRSLTQKFVR